MVRQYAIAILGRFFSLTVQIAEDTKCGEGSLQAGPPPSYTGFLITFTDWAWRCNPGRAIGTSSLLQYLVRIQNARRGADLVVGAGTGLCQLHEKDETAHTVPNLRYTIGEHSGH